MTALMELPTPNGLGKIRATQRTMETIRREFDEVLRNIGFLVHGQCPATGDNIDQCSQCRRDEDDETPLRAGMRPHHQHMRPIIKRLPKIIFEALEGVGITGKSQKAHRVKTNKYP